MEYVLERPLYSKLSFLMHKDQLGYLGEIVYCGIYTDLLYGGTPTVIMGDYDNHVYFRVTKVEGKFEVKCEIIDPQVCEYIVLHTFPTPIANIDPEVILVTINTIVNDMMNNIWNRKHPFLYNVEFSKNVLTKGFSWSFVKLLEGDVETLKPK